MYDLYAVCSHSGSLQSGHYIGISLIMIAIIIIKPKNNKNNQVLTTDPKDTAMRGLAGIWKLEIMASIVFAENSTALFSCAHAILLSTLWDVDVVVTRLARREGFEEPR